MEKILVGLSGGVDSAVSAYLLKEQGHDVTAGFMINYLADEGEVCPTREDIEVAREVAAFLDIPFFTFDYREEYEKKVLDYMYEGYKNGVTPNPDIMCNSEIKFKVFLDEALELGYDKIATGHYARIEPLPQSLPFQEREETKDRKSTVMLNYIESPDYVKSLVSKLRIKQTPSEEILWQILRRKQVNGLKFRRQHPFGRYIADFYCSSLKLVIELDGKIHENTIEYDTIRDEIIGKYGVNILRIKNHEVYNNIDGVIKKILQYFPSPERGGLGRGLMGEVSRDVMYSLKKGVDELKDQSYFLAGLSQDQLSKAIFPIGHIDKTEVRKIAQEIGLPNASRKDSQGICFVGKVNMAEFLEKKIQPQTGNIIDIQGNILGTHKGVFYFTVGQRKGLDFGGQKEPMFVIKKDILTNEITVGNAADLGLFSQELHISNMHYLGEDNFKFPLDAKAKVRYRQDDQECIIEEGKGGYIVKFTEAQRAIASGQICAIYQDDILIMSGVIS